MTFKDHATGMCNWQVKHTLPEGWSYSESKKSFVKAYGKKLRAIIAPNWDYNPAGMMSQPYIAVQHLDVARQWKAIFGRDLLWVHGASFSEIDHAFSGSYHFSEFGWDHEKLRNRPDYLTIGDAPGYLERMIAVGLAGLDKSYDLTSDLSFLRNLPAIEDKYAIVHCLVQVMLGNPNFIDEFLSDEFELLRRLPGPVVDGVRQPDRMVPGVKQTEAALKIKKNIAKIPVLT